MCANEGATKILISQEKCTYDGIIKFLQRMAIIIHWLENTVPASTLQEVEGWNENTFRKNFSPLKEKKKGNYTLEYRLQAHQITSEEKWFNENRKRRIEPFNARRVDVRQKWQGLAPEGKENSFRGRNAVNQVRAENDSFQYVNTYVRVSFILCAG